MAEPPDADARPNNLEGENDNLQAVDVPGAPRPATEPAGAGASQRTDKTATDPGSGRSDTAAPAPNQGPDQS